MKAAQLITAAELDEKLDSGDDISAYVDWSEAAPIRNPAR
jgi:hypothetical protein